MNVFSILFGRIIGRMIGLHVRYFFFRLIGKEVSYEDPLAKKFLSTPLNGQTGPMRLANAAMINALTGGHDYSNGAEQWDGAEQAMVSSTDMNKASNGKFMFKMNVMGWSISNSHYQSWKGAVEGKFGAGKFTVPQEKAALFNYGGMKNKGLIRLSSTAQYGLTIFWNEK